MRERLNTDQWKRVEQLFEAAVSRSPSERSAYLDQACCGDASLRAEVESLLAAESGVGDLATGGDLIEESIKGAARDVTFSDGQPIGQRIGPYEIVDLLGTGGMATVYRAVRADDEFKQQVAIKILRSGLEVGDARDRFRRERQFLADLDHPNIARLLDGGTTEDGTPYVVMEHVAGRTIDRYAAENDLSVDQRIELFRQVCSAVQYAHQRLVVHRDIKPSNVLVTDDGVPKLLDFGIAKLLDPSLEAGTPRTVTGLSWMTPEYASPEQVKGSALTTASDVYSMGALLYELLTEKRPYTFESKRPAEIERVVCEQTPTRPSSVADTRDGNATASTRSTRALRRALEGDLDNIALMALRKEPERRYGTAGELDQDLERYQRGLPVVSQPDTFAYRTGKFVKRHRWGVLLGVVSVLALAGFGTTMAVQSQRIAQERDAVTLERDKARSVADFMIGLLTARDRGGAAGGKITVGELIERGSEQLNEDALDQVPEIRAALLTAVGNVQGAIGNIDEAEAMIKEGFELRRQMLPGDHPDLAESHDAMGAVHYSRGAFDDALASYTQSYEIRRAAFGEFHEQTAEALYLIGNVHAYRGDMEKTDESYVRSLEIHREVSGPRSEAVLKLLGARGHVLASMGRTDEAVASWREALDVQIEIHGEDHLTVADVSNDLAIYLKNKGRFEEAEPLYLRSIETRRKHLGSHHLTGQLLNNYATFLRAAGRESEAGAFFAEAVEMYENDYGKKDVKTAQIVANHASWIRDNESVAKAKSMLDDVLEIYENSQLGADFWVAAAFRSDRAICMMRLGDTAAAEPEMLRAVNVLIDKRPHHRRARAAVDGLVELYESLGRKEDARRWSEWEPPPR